MPIRFASLLVSPQLYVSISASFRELLSSQMKRQTQMMMMVVVVMIYIAEPLWGEFQLKVRKSFYLEFVLLHLFPLQGSENNHM